MKEAFLFYMIKIKIQKLSDLDRITQEICANQSLIPVFLSIPVKSSILY